MFPHSVTAEEIRALLASDRKTELSPMARCRLECIADFLCGLSVSDTCQRFHITRGTLRRWIDRFNPDDLSSLEEQPHHLRSERHEALPTETEALVRAYRMRSPLVGKETIAQLLLREHGLTVSASSIGRLIERECLYFANTPHHLRKRMQRQSIDPAFSIQHTQESTPHARPIVAQPAKDPSALPHMQSKWQSIRRSVFIMSIVANVFFIGALLGIAWLEGRRIDTASFAASAPSHPAPFQLFTPRSVPPQ